VKSANDLVSNPRLFDYAMTAFGLSDMTYATVVQTALGISPLTSAEPIDTQAHMLSALINISDFKNPAKLLSFIERFAALYDSSNGGSNAGLTSSGSTVLSLFNSLAATSSGGGIDPALLLQAQNINFSSLWEISAAWAGASEHRIPRRGSSRDGATAQRFVLGERKPLSYIRNGFLERVEPNVGTGLAPDTR